MPRTNARACTRETRIARPRRPTVTGNTPIFSSPSLLPWFFRHGRPKECHAAASPARPGRKAHFLSWFFVIEVGPHHIYDDTVFCHNYCHRSVISMTEKKISSAQNVTDVSLNGAFWTHKKSGVQIRFRKWNPFVTDEFPDEILILWKRLSVLYTKCIQFLPSPSQLSCTCYVDEMMISCQL